MKNNQRSLFPWRPTRGNGSSTRVRDRLTGSRVAVAVIFALWAAFPMATGASDDTPGTATHIPAIVVFGGPSFESFESADDAAGFTQVIDTREAWQGYETVADLIEHGVGVQIRRFGGREDFATISIRGSTAAQVKILIDGVNISRAANDVVNLADLPMDSVERVEIFRGFTPVRFASSGAASVINIVTRKNRQGVSGSISLGSFATAKASLQAAAPAAMGHLSGSLTYRRTDGDFAFTNKTPDPSDDERTRRRNNDSESWDLSLRYDQKTRDQANLSIIGSTFHKEEGTPGLGANQALHAGFRSTRSILAARWESPRGLRAAADVTYVSEDQRDPKRPPTEPGLGFPYRRASSNTLATTIEAGGWREIGGNHFLEASVELSFERFEGRFADTAGTPPRRDQERYRIALATGDEIVAPGLNLTVTPQLRLEVVQNRFDGSGLIPPLSSSALPGAADSSFDPRIGIRWDATPSLTVKANLGTYFRPPNFGELFGDDGFSAANAALRPERGVNRDVGMLWKHRAGRLSTTIEYAYFNNDVTNMIVFVPSGARVPRPQNIGSARVRGHELRLDGKLQPMLSLEANYTRQQADNRAAVRDFRGKELPSLPSDELYARLSLERHGWLVAYALDVRGRVFLDRANFQRVPGYATHHVEVVLGPFGNGWRVKLEGDNLGDKQFSDVFGFPVPGRAFYLTLSYGGTA